MLKKNKKLPPLTPSRLEKIISTSPIQFSDLKVKISLIEKGRTSTSHELNNIITQLRDMYKSDCNAFSIISTSNSQKSSELSKLESEYQELDQKYEKFKSTASIVDILQKGNLQERIERLQNSINELIDKSKSFGGIPKMKKSNPNVSDVNNFLQLTDYNYQLLENMIYNLNKRTVIIDQSEDDSTKVNEKYGSVSNLVNLYKNCEIENQDLKDLEKKYFHDRLIRRYPLTKLTNLCNKLLADSLQHCFSQELSLLHLYETNYNDKEGNDASSFLKEESASTDNSIEKVTNEINQLEDQIKSSIKVPELDFDKYHSLNDKIYATNKECIEISQKIKQMVDEKNLYAKRSNEIQSRLKKLKEDQSLILLNENQNYESAKSLYQIVSTFGLSLILDIDRNVICDTVLKWISQKQDNKIENDTEKVEEEDSEFMTRPTSTIAPSICSLFNDNFIRYKANKVDKRKKGIELLTDGVICEFLGGLEISTKIGSKLKLVDTNSCNILKTSEYFKKYLNELSDQISANIDGMKNFMFDNIDIIQKIEHDMLIKEHEIKSLQVSLMNWNDEECQTEEIKKEKKKSK